MIRMKNMRNMIGTKMRILKSDKLKVLQFSGLSGFCNTSHFVTTRHGGVSKGNYASMNPGEYSGDDIDSVRENQKILSKGIGISSECIFAPYQVHGCEIAELDHSFLSLSDEGRKAYIYGTDALITNVAGLCVAVSTADCVPVLLYAADKKVVAAVHAGWRGTAQQIVAKTLSVMVDKYGCDPLYLFAGIAPSISGDAFEVGDEVVDAFRESGADMEHISFRNPETGKAHIDLWEENRLQLVKSGVPVSQIEISGSCTYMYCDEFFSALRLGIKSGRILSGIMIKDK